jgi:uroporphyrinogen decarboxylase
MIDTGADALELDYKTDINKAYAMCNNKVVFIGNIDPSGILALGTEKLVCEKTLELLKVYKNSNRFILNAGCALPSFTPERNIAAMIKTAREFE